MVHYVHPRLMVQSFANPQFCSWLLHHLISMLSNHFPNVVANTQPTIEYLLFAFDHFLEVFIVQLPRVSFALLVEYDFCCVHASDAVC